MPKINSLEVVHQDTNADKFDNLHDLLVKFKKFYDESAGKEVVDAEARAAYEALMEIYANDKEAFAKRIEKLTAEFGDALAQITEELFAYANKSEAYAKKTETVKAELDSAKASVEVETNARVAEDEALANQITTVESTLGTEIASVQTYAETIATTKNRTFRQGSQPTTGMIAGDLWFNTSDNNKSYRYDGVSWVATDDTRIATTYARWGVQVDAGGNVAGIQLNSSGVGSSNFIVLADNFKVYRAGYTSDPIFTTGTVNGVATVGIKGNLVVDGSIITAGIANNAVSATVSNTNTSSGGGNSAYQLTNTVTITNNSTSPMYITGTYQCQIYYSAIPALAGYRVLNGSGVEVGATSISSVPNEMPIVSFYDTVPANSSISYNGYFWGEAGKVTFNRGTLTVLGLKK